MEVLDGYLAEHPDVQIEWIRIPQGMQSREWTIAQQAADTIPHIVTHAHWYIKDDLDKNWWVELTPFLNEPNPYISTGEPGSDRWLNQFYPIPTGEALMRDGYYNLVFGLVTTFFYYNVDWFNDLGLAAPQTYAEFLDVCQAFRDEDVDAYGGWTGRVSDTDHWYRIQMGGMIMAGEIEPQVNPDRDTATYEEVACAIKSEIYNAHLPQYREWMELWKMNVPYRPPDWTIQATDSHSRFLNKVELIMENGTWSFPGLTLLITKSCGIGGLVSTEGQGVQSYVLGLFLVKQTGGVQAVHLQADGRPCRDSLSQVWIDGEGQERVRQAVRKNSFGSLTNHLGWLASGQGRVHVCEGLADGLHLLKWCGEGDVVAAACTSLSAKRLVGCAEALRGFQEVVLWPDGDEFGQRQGREAGNALRSRGIQVRIQSLPAGQDPASTSSERIKRLLGTS